MTVDNAVPLTPEFVEGWLARWLYDEEVTTFELRRVSTPNDKRRIRENLAKSGVAALFNKAEQARRGGKGGSLRL